MHRWTTTLFAALLGAAGPLGCVPISGGNDDAGRACPAIGCGPAYQVQFARGGAWGAGNYKVEVTADGLLGWCDVIMPLKCDLPPRCTSADTWIPILSGCALDPSQQSIEGVVFSTAAPTRVDVRVTKEERMLGAQTFTPAYRTFELSPGCGTCTQATPDRLPLTQ